MKVVSLLLAALLCVLLAESEARLHLQCFSVSHLRCGDLKKSKRIFDGCNRCSCAKKADPKGPLACTRMLCRKPFGKKQTKRCNRLRRHMCSRLRSRRARKKCKAVLLIEVHFKL